jgi:WD40 repeat protein
MAFTPDGQYLVTDSEKEFALWSLPSGSKITTLEKCSDQFMSLFGLSPNGQLALVGSREQRAVQVRTIPSLKQIATVPHDDTIYSARFTGNGSRVVTASADTTCRLWDTSSCQEVARLKTNGSLIEARFNADESLVATASNEEGLARLWIVRTADLISAVCHRLSRNLTPQEWHEYLGTEVYTSTYEVTSMKVVPWEK